VGRFRAFSRRFRPTEWLGEEFSLQWLNTRLLSGGRWPHGELSAVRGERIGLEFGLSGRTYRLFCQTVAGSRHSLVVKLESADKIRRAATFRHHNEDLLAASVPASYGWQVDPSVDRGVILLEDVSPAYQGDDLLGCSEDQARSVIETVGRLHSLTRPARREARAPAEQWEPPPTWEPERWDDRLARAHDRYPDQYTHEVLGRLAPLSDEAHAAVRRLADGPRSWVHHDPHLDNFLWRPDGTPVLLDWSGAVVGPPALDVAVLLTTLALRSEAPIRPGELLATYAATRRRLGVEADLEQVTFTASLALRRLIRGLVGWAGYPDSPSAGRSLAIRDDSVGRVLAGLDWLDSLAER